MFLLNISNKSIRKVLLFKPNQANVLLGANQLTGFYINIKNVMIWVKPDFD